MSETLTAPTTAPEHDDQAEGQDLPFELSETTPVDTSEQDPAMAEYMAKRDKAERLMSDTQLYRTDVREGITEAINTVGRKIAEGKNLLSTPKNMVLEWQRDRMQRKYDRVSAKQDTSRFEFVNRMRDHKAARLYNKLQQRESKLQGHNAMMEARLTRTKSAGMERLNAINARRAELGEKRVEALQRKKLRAARRAERQRLEREHSGISYAERERRVNLFTTPDFLATIRKLAEEELQDMYRGDRLHYAGDY